MEAGFIKLWRQMLFNECLNNSNDRKVLWITMLLKAKHKKETYNGTTMQPGEFITSYGKLARTIGVTKSALRTHLKHLTKHSMIAHQTSRKGTKITVLNWERYQSRAQSEHDLCTITEPHLSTQPAQKLATIKEEKKKRRKEYIGKTKKTVPVCNFFQCDELNKWIGNLPETISDRWCSYGHRDLLEQLATEAKEYAETSSKKYKAIARFVDNWFKRSNELKLILEEQENKKNQDKFFKYLDGRYEEGKKRQNSKKSTLHG